MSVPLCYSSYPISCTRFNLPNDEQTVQCDTADGLKITVVIPSGVCMGSSWESEKEAKHRANFLARQIARSKAFDSGRLVKA